MGEGARPTVNPTHDKLIHDSRRLSIGIMQWSSSAGEAASASPRRARRRRGRPRRRSAEATFSSWRASGADPLVVAAGDQHHAVGSSSGRGVARVSAAGAAAESRPP